jgi:hypothetical protein
MTTMTSNTRAAVALIGLAALASVAACKPAQPAAAAASAGAPSGGALQPASTTPTAASGSAMVTYTDPTEAAFSLSVPQGWTVKGGVQRTNTVTANPWIIATSPDGATSVSIGDPSIPSFTLPSQVHAAGSIVQNAAGAQSPVESYETSIQFAGDYAQRAWGKSCALQAAGSQAEPGLAQTAQAASARIAQMVGVAPSQANYDGGSARFTCGANTVAVLDVTTQTQGAYSGGFWNVPLVFAYSTPSASQAQTDQLARAMRASWQPNAQWQAKMVAATQQVMAANQRQGQAEMAALVAQEHSENNMLSAQEASANAQLNAEHAATMDWLNGQQQRIDSNFAAQQYNKQTGQQSEMRYINNQTCIAWYDDAHTRCKTTAQQ